jgi:hypothetical protein
VNVLEEAVMQNINKLFGSIRWCYKCRRKSRHVIVRSRRGGFVTQNCESCGNARSLAQAELPDRNCERRAVSTILRQPGSAIYCSDSTVRMSAVD